MTAGINDGQNMTVPQFSANFSGTLGTASGSIKAPRNITSFC